MKRVLRTTRNLLLACVIAGVSSAQAMASQDPPRQAAPGGRQGGQRGRLPAARPGMPVPQLQAMFDAYALVQAQRALQLSNDQYDRFVSRMTRLQDVRRKHMQQRMRLLGELRRKWRPETEEAELVTLTKQIDDLDATFDTEQRTARRAVDEVLTPRQGAFLRFFEEDMERQKIDFITRSRQNPVPAPGRGKRP
jgi:hypothetical protein